MATQNKRQLNSKSCSSTVRKVQCKRDIPANDLNFNGREISRWYKFQWKDCYRYTIFLKLWLFIKLLPFLSMCRTHEQSSETVKGLGRVPGEGREVLLYISALSVLCEQIRNSSCIHCRHKASNGTLKVWILSSDSERCHNLGIHLIMKMWLVKRDAEHHGTLKTRNDA